MKKLLCFKFFGVTLIICVLLFLKYDSKGYEYGIGCIFCNKIMPYNLEPKYISDYPQRFYLLDEDKFELVGIGFMFYSNSFEIKDILAYGFNDTSVIVKCTDSLNTIKYLVSFETGYKSKNGNPKISFKDIINNDLEQVKDIYQWFEIDEEKVNTVRFMKFLFFVGALLSLFFIVKKFR